MSGNPPGFTTTTKDELVAAAANEINVAHSVASTHRVWEDGRNHCQTRSLISHMKWIARARLTGSLVLIVVFSGLVLSSPASAAGLLKWSAPTRIHRGAMTLSGVSCPSASFCAAVGGAAVYVSRDPGARAPRWDSHTIAGANMQSISCPSPSLCVGLSSTGRPYASTNPAAAHPSWRAESVQDEYFYALTCASTSLCVAVDALGEISTSTNPGAANDHWTTAHVDFATVPSVCTDPASEQKFPCSAPAALTAVACPSRSFCIAVDQTGNALTSTNPSAGAGAWKLVPIDPTGTDLNSVSCASVSLCVAADNRGHVLASAHPNSAGGWRPALVDPGDSGGLSTLSCTRISFCVGAGVPGGVIVSAKPTAGAKSWTRARIRDANVAGLSCASRHLCVAVTTNAKVIVGH